MRNGDNNLQRTLTGTLQQFMSDKDQINCDLVKILAEADIPLEKVDKLLPFLFKYSSKGI